MIKIFNIYSQVKEKITWPKYETFLSVLSSSVLLILASPPYDLWPLAFVCLIPLYFRVRNESPLRAAALSWVMGFIAILWICSWWMTLLKAFAGMSYFSGLFFMILICAYQSLIFAVWAGICRFLDQRFKLNWLITAPLSIVVIETFLPFIFKINLGITLWRAWPITQIAEIGGVPVISGLIVLGNLIIAELILAIKEKRKIGLATRIAVGVILIIFIGSIARAMQVSSIRSKAESIPVGIIQPNFGVMPIQKRKLMGSKYVRSLRKATNTLSKKKIPLVLWPESSWPYPFDRKMEEDFPVGHPWKLQNTNTNNSSILIGTLTSNFETREMYNSAVLLNANGRISGRYDKNHLFPFGEYVPLKQSFPDIAKKIKKRTPDMPELEPGKSVSIIENGHLRIGVLICSEDLNASYAQKVVRKNPNLLVSLANDGWFSDSGAAEQHLALASFRAVETRRDMARCTNTGISAIIGANGKMIMNGPLVKITKKELQDPTILTGDIKLMSNFSMGVYLINYFPIACLIVLVALAMFAWKKER